MNRLDDIIATLQRMKDATDNETRAMTIGEAAYTLGKSKQTISRYIEQGKLHKASANGVTGVWAKEVYKLIWK
jgi:response regulator of citrate/malate metabolism